MSPFITRRFYGAPLLILFFLGASVLYSLPLTQASPVTPQQLDVLKSKNTAWADSQKASQENAYTNLDRHYHQQVTAFMESLPPSQQRVLLQHEQQWTASTQRIRENTLDAAETQSQDLNMLWQAAVYRSQPIRYAIEKLSRQDASGKPSRQKNRTKQVVNGLAQVGGAATSIMTGTPVGLLSGALVNDIIAQSNSSNTKPVTDADMVILARAVDTLQQELLTLYLNYKAAEDRLSLQASQYQILEATYQLAQDQIAQNKNKNIQTHTTNTDITATQLMQYMLNEAKASLNEAETALQQSKHDLGLKVGPEALALVEAHH